MNIKFLTKLSFFFFLTSLYATDTKVLLDTQKTWNGAKIKRVKVKNPKINVLEIKMKPGEKLPEHKHLNINVGYVIEGELTVFDTKNKKNQTFKKGDSFAEVINQWHYGENTGKEELVLLVFVFGEKTDKTIMKN